MRLSGVLGELTQPPRRISKTRCEVVGLVTCPVGVTLPASTAEPVAEPSNQRPALRAWPGRFGDAARVRAWAAPAGVGTNEPVAAASLAARLGISGCVASTAGSTTDAGLEPERLTAVDAGV